MGAAGQKQGVFIIIKQTAWAANYSGVSQLTGAFTLPLLKLQPLTRVVRILLLLEVHHAIPLAASGRSTNQGMVETCWGGGAAAHRSRMRVKGPPLAHKACNPVAQQAFLVAC